MQRNLNDLEGLYDDFIKYCQGKASQDVRNDVNEQHETDSHAFMIIERLISN